MCRTGRLAGSVIRCNKDLLPEHSLGTCSGPFSSKPLGHLTTPGTETGTAQVEITKHHRMRTVILNILDNKKSKPLQVKSTHRGNDQICGSASAGSGICHVRDLGDRALDRYVSALDFKNLAQRVCFTVFLYVKFPKRGALGKHSNFGGLRLCKVPR